MPLQRLNHECWSGLGLEPETSRSVVRRSTNWANRSLVKRTNILNVFFRRTTTTLTLKQNIYRPSEADETNRNLTPVTTVTIPYIKGTSETISRILQPYNIRVAHKPTTTLRHLFYLFIYFYAIFQQATQFSVGWFKWGPANNLQDIHFNTLHHIT